MFIGSTLIPTGFNNTGHVTAYSMETGRIAWRVEFPGESCYSGTVTTAGNLVFVGRNTGDLEAYNATDGRLLWRFQTGAGANSTVTSFQHKGKQYIAFLSGGNALAATPRGDYGLAVRPRRLGRPRLTTPAPAEASRTPARSAARRARPSPREEPGNAGAGRTVFADNCSTCHGIDGRGGNGGPDLTRIPAARNLSDVIDQVVNGGGSMPAFGGTLDPRSIADVSALRDAGRRGRQMMLTPAPRSRGAAGCFHGRRAPHGARRPSFRAAARRAAAPCRRFRAMPPVPRPRTRVRSGTDRLDTQALFWEVTLLI